MRVTIRLNDVKDKPLCDVLNNAADMTKAIKILLYKGLYNSPKAVTHDIEHIDLQIDDSVFANTIPSKPVHLTKQDFKNNLLKNSF